MLLVVVVLVVVVAPCWGDVAAACPLVGLVVYLERVLPVRRSVGFRCLCCVGKTRHHQGQATDQLGGDSTLRTFALGLT